MGRAAEQRTYPKPAAVEFEIARMYAVRRAHTPKFEVAGSSPVSRSSQARPQYVVVIRRRRLDRAIGDPGFRSLDDASASSIAIIQSAGRSSLHHSAGWTKSAAGRPSQATAPMATVMPVPNAAVLRAVSWFGAQPISSATSDQVWPRRLHSSARAS
jgi:hypothetical protein